MGSRMSIHTREEASLADKRTYIRVHDGMPDHPKVEALTDKAFRLLMETWCWCSRQRTDGRVPNAVWAKRGAKKTRDELATAGLVEIHDGYVQMHDYLEHQRSAEQITDGIEKKRAAGILGNHNRWHVNGFTDPNCEWCTPTNPPHPPSHKRSHTDRTSDRRCDDEPIANRDTDTDTDTDTKNKNPTPVGMAPHDSNVRDEPRPPGATGPTGVDAFRLVRRVLGLDYPAATCTALAYHAADLLKQYDEATVQAGLEDWLGRTGIGPGVLPSLVADLIKRRNGHAKPARRKPNADDTIAELLTPTGSEGGATILQLTRGNT